LSWKISNEYGYTIRYSPRSYDMGCRVAHFMRELTGDETWGLVSGETGRLTSEVSWPDSNKDRYARMVAGRFV
jgi:hypothetical protein